MNQEDYIGKEFEAQHDNPIFGKKTNRMEEFIKGLSDSNDESIILDTLFQLCDFLSMSNEDTLTGFSSDSFVPILVNLLNFEHNPDIMLLSARGICHLIEALPTCCPIIVANGAVQSFCQKLLSIEYIDLAEQSLTALERLSLDHSLVLLKEGALTAVLSYLDFFQVGVQRVAVSIAANICKHINTENFSLLLDNIPLLTNLLQYSDAKVVENAILCFARLVELLPHSPTQLKLISEHGLVNNLIILISDDKSVASTELRIQIIRILYKLCENLPELAVSLLEQGIHASLSELLNGDSSTNSRASTLQQYELLCLLNELLPPLPSQIRQFFTNTQKVETSQPLKARSPAKFAKKRLTKRSSSPSRNQPTQDETPEKDSRFDFIENHADLLISFNECIFLKLMEILSSNVTPGLNHKCLSIVSKIIHFSTDENLKELLRNHPFSSFLASLLGKDLVNCAISLDLAEVLMKKLPEIFSVYFIREGVCFEIEQICENPIEYCSGTSTEVKKSLNLSVDNDDQENATVISTLLASTTLTEAEIIEFVTNQSLNLKENYLKTGSKTAVLTKLKTLSKKLQKKDLNDDTVIEIFGKICDLLTDEEGVTTFEFSHSGIVANLLSFLTESDDEKILLKRNHIFSNIFFKIPLNTFYLENEGMKIDTTEFPISILVKKLEDTFTSFEKYAVVLNSLPGVGGLKYLTQPFKCKVIDLDNEKQGLEESNILKEVKVDLVSGLPVVENTKLNGNTILVEPLATVKSVSQFLKTKIIKERAGQLPKTELDTQYDDEGYFDEDEEEDFIEEISMHEIKLPNKKSPEKKKISDSEEKKSPKKTSPKKNDTESKKIEKSPKKSPKKNDPDTKKIENETKNVNNDFYVELWFENNLLNDQNSSIFQIFQKSMHSNLRSRSAHFTTTKMWANVHNLNYKIKEGIYIFSLYCNNKIIITESEKKLNQNSFIKKKNNKGSFKPDVNKDLEKTEKKPEKNEKKELNILKNLKNIKKSFEIENQDSSNFDFFDKKGKQKLKNDKNENFDHPIIFQTLKLLKILFTINDYW